IADVELEQTGTATRALEYTVDGENWTWDIQAGSVVQVIREGGTLHFTAGYSVGTEPVTVTLTDSEGQAVSRTFAVTVTAKTVEPTPPPNYPHAPIILWNDDEPWDILPEPLSGVVTKEVDGEETFTFTFLPGDPRADIIETERSVTVAGDQ